MPTEKVLNLDLAVPPLEIGKNIGTHLVGPLLDQIQEEFTTAEKAQLHAGVLASVAGGMVFHLGKENAIAILQGIINSIPDAELKTFQDLPQNSTKSH